MAIAGASRDPKKFGHLILKAMEEKGIDSYPINPHAESILNKTCYKDIATLPEDVDRLIICTNKNITTAIVDEAIQKGIKHIWIQQTSETKEAVEKAEAAGINLIYNKCVFMFAEPVNGIHKFHRALVKFFEKYPK